MERYCYLKDDCSLSEGKKDNGLWELNYRRLVESALKNKKNKIKKNKMKQDKLKKLFLICLMKHKYPIKKYISQISIRSSELYIKN